MKKIFLTTIFFALLCLNLRGMVDYNFEQNFFKVLMPNPAYSEDPRIKINAQIREINPSLIDSTSSDFKNLDISFAECIKDRKFAISLFEKIKKFKEILGLNNNHLIDSTLCIQDPEFSGSDTLFRLKLEIMVRINEIYNHFVFYYRLIQINFPIDLINDVFSKCYGMKQAIEISIYAKILSKAGLDYKSIHQEIISQDYMVSF